MANVNDGMWMENLEEFVFEEKKAVTYKWLSRTLKIHVNVAKQMLYEFAQKNKEKVSSVYLLAGNTKNNNFCVKLAKEENLSKCESLFSSLTSKHVHTVAATTGVDYTLSAINLLSIDTAIRKESKPTTAFSGIINKSGVPRSERRVEEEQPPAVEVKKETPAPKQNPKSSIEGMFNKQKEKGDAKDSNTSTNVPTKPVAAKKKGGIAGMFAKQAASSVTKKALTEAAPKVESPEISPGKENLSNHLKEKEQEKVVKRASEKEPAAKKRLSSQKFENPSKRRKRIQVASDSESSDDDDESNKVEEPASPPPPQAAKIESDDDDDVIPSTPVEKDGKAHRRVRKMIKKTYVDEDGFMVTKMEMGSCSEDESSSVEPPTAKLTQLASASTEKTVKPSPVSSNSSSGGKSKQASIRNFFQKK